MDVHGQAMYITDIGIFLDLYLSFMKYQCILIYFKILTMRKMSQNKFILCILLSSISALDLEVGPLVDAYSECSNYFKIFLLRLRRVLESGWL